MRSQKANSQSEEFSNHISNNSITNKRILNKRMLGNPKSYIFLEVYPYNSKKSPNEKSSICILDDKINKRTKEIIIWCNFPVRNYWDFHFLNTKIRICFGIFFNRITAIFYPTDDVLNRSEFSLMWLDSDH